MTFSSDKYFALGVAVGLAIGAGLIWLIGYVFRDIYFSLRDKYQEARRQLDVIGEEVVNRMLVEIAIDNGTLPQKGESPRPDAPQRQGK